MTINHDRRRCALPCLVLVAGLVGIAGGCGGGAPSVPSKPPDRNAARALLEKALEAWKADQVASLANEQPPVRFVDSDAMAGSSLTAYTISGEGTALGPTLNFPVEITVKARKGGATKTTNANYQVALEPSPGVFRNDE